MGYLHDVIDDKLTDDIPGKINEILSLRSIEELKPEELAEVMDTIKKHVIFKEFERYSSSFFKRAICSRC